MDERYKAKGSPLRRIVSTVFLLPAWFSPHSKIRVFFHRLRGVKIGRGVEIGYFCVIGNVHPTMISIGDGAVIAAKAVLLEHDNSYYYSRGGQVKFGPVKIGARAFVGVHAVVMPDVTVGEGAIVGANSVVLEDVPAGSVVGGLPARILKRF